MNLQHDKYTSIVTGGAGFIGSHLSERLLKEGHKVIILDNFSSGKLRNIQNLLSNPSLTFVKEDLKKPVELGQIVKKCQMIFHLAANPEVRAGETHPKIHFEENLLTTFNLLEAVKEAKGPKTIIFTSTSAVYGEASQIPTPEDYAPLFPISTYGASKLACEALISGYVHTFNLKALILRLANIVGPRSNHGVIVDFIRKINSNPKRLEVLGDGTQEKSYLHVTDCVEAIMHLISRFVKSTSRLDVCNIGSNDKITVEEIAKIVAEEMKVPGIELVCTGGVDGGRGWKGDVKTMQLSINKLLKTGWRPQNASDEAVRLASRTLAAELITNPRSKDR